PHRPVERAPAVFPARLDVVEARVGERGGDASRSIVVRGELDGARQLALLEPLGRELEEARAQLLRAVRRDRDGGPDQWKWLLSRSKKPSCLAYVSWSLAWSNSPSSRRCSSVSRRGTVTLTSTRWSPRPCPWSTGIPRPRSVFISPGWVPGSNSSCTGP